MGAIGFTARTVRNVDHLRDPRPNGPPRPTPARRPPRGLRGTVPDLDRLAERYAGLAPGASRFYDAALDSTFDGGATYLEFGVYPFAGPVLRTDDYDEAEGTGLSVFVSSESFQNAGPGAEFDVRVAYDIGAEEFGSVEGRARVTGAGPGGDVVGVFYARVRSEGTLGIGVTRVVEGGFNAPRSKTVQ